MLRERPGSVLAAAVMAIIYGSLFSLCNLCGVASVAGQSTMNQLFAAGNPQQIEMQKKMQEAMERDAPGLRIMQTVQPIVGLVEAIALLIAGIGLLGMRRWARLLAVVTSLVAMITTAISTIYQVVFVMPATTNAMQAAMPAMPPGPAGPQVANIMTAAMGAGMAVGIAFALAAMIYLAVIVILLVRPNVRAAFADDRPAAAALDLPERDDEDVVWDRSQRERNPEDDWRIK